ncbi:MAG: esterase/lipase family protein, partial [Candidatus Hodarchaeales archaeon]
MKKKIFVLSLIVSLSVSTGAIGVNAFVQENNTGQNPILFVHGWTKDKTDWESMTTWFQSDGWAETKLFSNNFDDTNNCSDAAHIDHAKKIKGWVDEILNQTGATKIDLVGHSSGGLSSRYYAKFLNGIEKIDDLVTLASPNHGTTHIDGAPCFSAPNNLHLFLIELNEGDETPGGILNDTLGDRVDLTLETTYNGTHIPGNINYTSIYSVDDTPMVPYDSPILEGAYNIEISGVGHSMYKFKFVYELVKTAVFDPDTTESTTAFITLRDVLFIV